MHINQFLKIKTPERLPTFSDVFGSESTMIHYIFSLGVETFVQSRPLFLAVMHHRAD